MKSILVEKGRRFSLSSKAGGLWGWHLSPSDLSDGEKDIIFDNCYKVGLKAFVQKDSPQMKTDVYHHLFQEDSLLIVMDNDFTQTEDSTGASVVAFLTSRSLDFNGKKILYLSGICVDPSYQGFGISGKLINEAYELGKYYDVMALKTQNPVMKQCFDNCVGGKSSPNIGAEISKEIERIGLFFADLFKVENYQAQSLIMKGIYGSCLYGCVPISRDESYNILFNQLDKSAGDSMLCLKVLA